MNKQEELVTSFLSQLGFNNEAIVIYIGLVKNGPSTLLQISKNCRLERTKLYRLIDDFIKRGVIEEVPAYKKKTVKAVDLKTIEFLVRKKHSDAQVLSESFGIFSDAVKSIESQSLPDVNVTYYRGIEGMKQMIWHLTSCEGIYRTYSYRFWNDIIGDKFTFELNKVMNEKNFKVHDIYSDQYIKYKENWMKTRGKKPSGDWSFWQSRFISEKIVKIDQNIDIYNDIVAYSYWDGSDMFGLEIKNQRVADMQKQVHDVLWKISKKVDHFDWQNPRWE